MPGPANRVGLLELPLAAGEANSEIDDPTVSGLLDYFSHWIRASLNTKLANLAGTSADAVPTANRFPWGPERGFVRGAQDGAVNPFPALYVWWTGKSQRRAYSSLKDIRRREIGIAWLYDDLVYPGAMTRRHGLLASVDAALENACSLKYHPSYSYNGGKAGQAITVSLKLAGDGLNYLGGQATRWAAIPGDGAANAGLQGGRDAGHNIRAYPVLDATVEVFELVEQFMPNDPEDVGREILTTLSTADQGSPDDAIEIMQRYLPKPDGTEPFPNP